MPETTIAHYRVLRKLGQGGMGEVYLAEDPRLQRVVALKLLPAERAADRKWRQRRLRAEEVGNIPYLLACGSGLLAMGPAHRGF